MFKTLKSLAPAAIVVATLATTTVQARQTNADAPEAERVAAQAIAKTQAQAPYFWLVLGVGY